MSAALGKRKRPSAGASSGKGDDAVASAASAAALDIFRSHFESQFKPLAVLPPKTKRREKDSDDDGNDASDAASDWSGFSDDDDDEDATPAVQVADYSVGTTVDASSVMTKQERRAYLSRTPSAVKDDDDDKKKKTQRKRRGKGGADNGDNDDDDDSTDGPNNAYKDANDLLANDLALQRLISESHLLSAPSALVALSAVNTPLKSSRPFAAGRLRARATDLRVQAAAHKAGRGSGSSPLSILSAGSSSSSGTSTTSSSTTSSIFTQTNMPMSHRKGMVAATAEREARRRREARESGIVLERPAAKTTKSVRKRLRDVDAPAVGKLHGSELRLRDRDIRAIQGPSKPMGKKKGKRR